MRPSRADAQRWRRDPLVLDALGALHRVADGRPLTSATRYRVPGVGPFEAVAIDRALAVASEHGWRMEEIVVPAGHAERARQIVAHHRFDSFAAPERFRVTVEPGQWCLRGRPC